MGYGYDYRLGLLGMSMVCFASGIALLLTLLAQPTPSALAAGMADADRREALRVLAEVYGARAGVARN